MFNNLNLKIMPEIIQLPQNGGNQNGGMSVLPVANGGGLFNGNGQTSLTDILGFAVIASIFPNIFGNGYGNRGNCGGGGCGCPAVDTQLALQAVTAQGDASRAAIENLASAMGQNYSTVLPAIQGVQNTLAGLASANGMGFLQVINALQQGNCTLAGQLQQCCCDNRLLTTTQGYENQLRMEAQTNALNGSINANGQRQVDAIADLKTTMIKEFCDARERDMQAIIDKQADEISQLRTKDNINAQTSQIIGYVNAQLAPIQATVKEMLDKMPNTVPVQYPNLQVVNNTPNSNWPGFNGYPGYGYRGGF
jgi:hypothetical protein